MPIAMLLAVLPLLLHPHTSLLHRMIALLTGQFLHFCASPHDFEPAGAPSCPVTAAATLTLQINVGLPWKPRLAGCCTGSC
jgi:hypothetical protein